MTNLRAMPSALGIYTAARLPEPGTGREPGHGALVARIEQLERELELTRRERRRLRALILAARRARRLDEQRAHAEYAQRMESVELLLRRADEADQVAGAAHAARESAERRATRAESLVAGLERLLRDDTARCAHVYAAVQRLRVELDSVRATIAAPAPELAGAIEPDRLTAALTRLREAAPPRGSEEIENARVKPDHGRPWRTALRRLTRRLA